MQTLTIPQPDRKKESKHGKDTTENDPKISKVTNRVAANAHKAFLEKDKTPSIDEAPQTLIEFIDRVEKHLPAAATQYERGNLSKLFTNIRGGQSFDDAALNAGFSLEKPGRCTPAVKARFVLQSFLEDQKAKRELEWLDQIIPVKAELNEPWVKEGRKQENFQGRVWKMSALHKNLMKFSYDIVTNEIVAEIPSGKADWRFEDGLKNLLSHFNRGELRISLGMVKDGQIKGIKIEKTSGSKCLLCLHIMSDSRLYGTYDNRTGELVWEGIISHNRWGDFIVKYRFS